MRQAPKRSEEEGRLCVVREEREHGHIWKPCVTCQPRRSISCCRQAQGQFFNELEIGTRVGRGAANTILFLCRFCTAEWMHLFCLVLHACLCAVYSTHSNHIPVMVLPCITATIPLLQSFCPALWLEMLRQADLQIERDVERAG